MIDRIEMGDVIEKIWLPIDYLTLETTNTQISVTTFIYKCIKVWCKIQIHMYEI